MEDYYNQESCSRAVAFGRNYYFALGGATPTSLPPNNADAVDGYAWDRPPFQDEIVQAVCTTQSSLFLTDEGKVYQTGTIHGKVFQTPLPVAIPLPLKCVEIAAGRHFCLGRMQGGLAVVSWGAGHFGQLGIGSPEQSMAVTFAAQPVVIERLLPHVIGSAVAEIAAGDWHALARTESGRLWAWGSNRSQQCGRKPPKGGGQNIAPTITLPLPVATEIQVQQIAAGRSHSVALSDGQVYCWGSSNHGQCGNSVRRSSGISPPRKVSGLAELTVTQVAAGGNHTLALTNGGRVFSWGAGSEGQLGLGPATPSQPKPRLVADLDFVAVAAGHDWKQQQRAGNPSASQQHPLSNVPRISKVYAGAAYSAAVSTVGHVYIWGSNDACQTGVPKPPSVPLQDNYNDHSMSSHGSLRDLHVRTFDSRHNLLLPVRMEAAQHLKIRLLACGPNHLWCIGQSRGPEETAVGKTLYELQEGERARKLQRAKNSLMAKAAASRDGAQAETSEQDDLLGDLTETSYGDYNETAAPIPSTPETPIAPPVVITAGVGPAPPLSAASDFPRTDVTSTPIHEKEAVSIPSTEMLQAPTPHNTPGSTSSRSARKRFSLRKMLRRMSSGSKRGDKASDRGNESDSLGSSRQGRPNRQSTL